MQARSTTQANCSRFSLTASLRKLTLCVYQFCDFYAATQQTRQVQLQTLTAVVKLFLKKPDSSQTLVQGVLNTATRDCDSPDVRDRAYIYWRLLSMDPAAAKASRLELLPTPADCDEFRQWSSLTVLLSPFLGLRWRRAC